jgi:antitoxin component of MazEF toxin-antitoxin module
MSPSYYELELEQDTYGSAVIPLPDELCHDLSLQPNERFEVEVEDDIITLKRVHAGYVIDQ